MSIEQKEWIELRTILIPLIRASGEQKATEAAMLQVWTDLARHWNDSEVTEILSRYDDYKQKHLVAALLELEKRFPSLAAELDAGRPVFPASQNTDEESPSA